MAVGETGIPSLDSLFQYADPRVETWPLMSSPAYPLAILFLYLSARYWWAGVYFDHFPPFDQDEVTPYVRIWNMTNVFANLVLGSAYAWLMVKAKYSALCQPVNPTGGEYENGLATCMWIFHLFKLVELGDTFFILARGVPERANIFHIYHHSSMVLITWAAVKFVPGGNSVMTALINCLFHGVIYFGHKLSLYFEYEGSFGTIINSMLFAQFGVISLHALVSYYLGLGGGCKYPAWALITLMSYMSSFGVLFALLYFIRYLTQ